MSDIPTITIEMGKICPECGKGGAANNGLCMGCTLRAMQGKPMRTKHGRNVQKHIRRVIKSARQR